MRGMTTLSALHGYLGIAIICALVLVEETGVPVPFAPGDLLLVVAGSQAAAGMLNGLVLIPCLAAASVTGALVGRAWSRALGATRLRALAARVHAAHHLDRVEHRVAGAGSGTIVIARLLPGLRVYTNLAAGAFRVPFRVYLRGLLVSVALWISLFTGLGMVAAAPVEEALASLEHVATLALMAAAAAAVLWGVGVLHRRGHTDHATA